MKNDAIFHFIKNFNIRDYELRWPEMFEGEEIGILYESKKKYLKMESEISELLQQDYMDHHKNG